MTPPRLQLSANKGSKVLDSDARHLILLGLVIVLAVVASLFTQGKMNNRRPAPRPAKAAVTVPAQGQAYAPVAPGAAAASAEEAI